MLPNVLPHSEADHVPVLAERVRELLAVRPGDTVVDATFGAGGHARLLAEDLAWEGKLVAIDRDPSAKSFFDRFRARAGVDVRFLSGDFAVVLTQLAANGVKADAILLDLGISSMQVDRPERGGDDPDDEGDRDERLHDRDDPRLGAEVERRRSEGDDEAEAEHHGRGAEREHEEPVEQTSPEGTAFGVRHLGVAVLASDRERRDAAAGRVHPELHLARDDGHRRAVAARGRA